MIEGAAAFKSEEQRINLDSRGLNAEARGAGFAARMFNLWLGRAMQFSGSSTFLMAERDLQ